MKVFSLIALVALLPACASTPPATAQSNPAQPVATRQSTAVVDPVGSYEFSTVVDGQTVTGTMHVEGAPGNYKGRILTSVFPEIPIVGASVEANTIVLRGSMPDGELVIRMAMENENFKGNWALGGGSGEISGKKLAK